MRTHFSHWLVSSTVALAALLPLAAPAQTLPAATTNVLCFSMSDGTETHVNELAHCALGGANASLTLLPDASASVHAQYGGGINNLVQANASIKYYFQIVGGNPGDNVPLLISTSLGTLVSDTDGGGASASLFVHTASGGGIPDMEVDACTNAECGGAGPTFIGTLATTGISGDDGDFITINLIAGVGDSFDARTADASADPWIHIDPTFAGASNYRVVVSEGVGNAAPGQPITPVPEPPTVVLLALGVGALLRRRNLSLRRSRQRTSPST